MASHRGAPLVMIVLLLCAWGGVRALWWQNPLGPPSAAQEAPFTLPPMSLAPAALEIDAPPMADEAEGFMLPPLPPAPPPLPPQLPRALAGGGSSLTTAAFGWPSLRRYTGRIDPQLAASHSLMWYAALREQSLHRPEAGFMLAAGERAANPPFLPPSPPAAPAASAAPSERGAGRWSADAWAFWRQGSDAAPISQGRVPIYGASQAGGVLQYRVAPRNPRDPRLYARTYRALVVGGESELALGASARPFGRVPLRLAGEVRYTDGAFRSGLRPAGYAVTEIAPIALPYGTQLEAYAQAGWVGGAGATPFADGQASITRDLGAVSRWTNNAMRLSLGAGAWGGAQKDAQRLDIGPTMRVDVTLGKTPARVSVDWRERVAGDASPGSGLAATLSTQF